MNGVVIEPTAGMVKPQTAAPMVVRSSHEARSRLQHMPSVHFRLRCKGSGSAELRVVVLRFSG